MRLIAGLSERARKEQLAAAIREKALRIERAKQEQNPGGLIEFVRYFWSVLEPADPLVEGWVLEAICTHLEAVTRGEPSMRKLLMNVSPGSMKSLMTNVFWPAWEWGPQGMGHLRYVCFSYAAELTERDNKRFGTLISSPEYQEMWKDRFAITALGMVHVANDKMGWKFASSVRGVGTGARGHRVIFDDLHNVKEAESDTVRHETVRWFREAMSNRLNDLKTGSLTGIMQRTHEEDVSGAILEDGDYTHLCIPMEYESARHCVTPIGWEDPRQEDGELAWPERFPGDELAKFKRQIYLWAGQYQQRPAPRGGGIFKEEWWQTYEVPSTRAYDFQPIFVVASLDTAFKEKEENDYSALTVWAVYDDDKSKNRRIMMVDAWKRRLPLHGVHVPRGPSEKERDYLRRSMPQWGLTEWVNYTCQRRKVDRLIVEDSARGHDLNNEIRRLHGARNWGVHLIPARGDKTARAHSVVDLFTDGMIYAPGEWLCHAHNLPHCKLCTEDTMTWRWRDWAQMVITDMSVFPKGAHDDIVDSAVHALRHLRDIGLAIRREERQLTEEMMAKERPKPGVAAGYFA